MSMPVRSRRDTSFASRRTPNLVGPGRYNVQKPEEEFVPSYTGFSTSASRRLNENTSTSATTPGPGAYKHLNRPSTTGNSTNNRYVRLQYSSGGVISYHTTFHRIASHRIAYLCEVDGCCIADGKGKERKET